MKKIKIRIHRGGYAESMETVKEIDARRDAVMQYVNEFFNDCVMPPVEFSSAKKYGRSPDPRNNWDTHIVVVKSQQGEFPVGFISGALDE